MVRFLMKQSLSYLQAFCILWATLGFKRAFKVGLKYPALVLSPCFGSWTYGPIIYASSSKCCMLSCKSNQISLSYFHTWMNYGLSWIGGIATFFYVYDGLPAFEEDVELIFKDGFNIWARAISVLLSWFLTIFVLPISIGFVQTVDKCCNCCTCCPCCPAGCFPVIRKTKLDVDNMERDIYN